MKRFGVAGRSNDLSRLRWESGYVRAGVRSIWTKRKLQIAAAAVLFLVAALAAAVNYPPVPHFKEVVSHYLTDKESDWSPLIIAAVREGIWTDTFEQKVFEAFSKIGYPAGVETEPMSVPVSGSIVRGFGWEESADGSSVLHPGIDILAIDPASPVRAALPGEVSTVGQSERLGKYVEIDHGNGIQTVYGNCGEILVTELQKVEKGQLIAELPAEAGAKLHFEVVVDGTPVDPAPRLISGSGGI